jgi:hypothetical protein
MLHLNLNLQQDEGLNEPQQDGQKETPQRQCKEWPCD